MITMPFINDIGRSVAGWFSGEAEVSKQKRIETLRNTMYDLGELDNITKTPGWIALEKRCADRMAGLQAQLESAKPDEVVMIQKQIRVLRDVIDVSTERGMLEATQRELSELTA